MRKLCDTHKWTRVHIVPTSGKSREKLSRRDPRKKAFIENRIKDVKKSRNEQIKEDIFLMRLE